MREAAKEYKWELNYGSIALMWRGGCIIRSRFLGNIKKAFDSNKNLENLLLDEFFTKATANAQVKTSVYYFFQLLGIHYKLQ